MQESKSKLGVTLLGGVVVAIASLVLYGSLWASSPDKWDEFRKEMSDACAAGSEMGDPAVTVDPFGTSSYGVALVSGTRAGDTADVTLVCVATKSPDGPVDVERSGPIGEFVEAAAD
ncbi:MAG: hypothetical protein WD044_11605 [Dongiaceae bacterium]